ncbi:helix-turn-helix transcriptional regulator [Actinocorallia longicatena]
MADALAVPGSDPPTWRQRRLALELKRIRESRGLGLHAAAHLLGRTESSLSKLENAQRGIRRPALEQILDKYAVTDLLLRESLFALARNAKSQGWWQTYEGMSSAMFDYISIEAASASIRTWQLHLIPGLLQTDDYARAVIASGISMGKPPDIEGLAAIRSRRQQLLTSDDPPHLRVVMSEACLMQEFGGPQVRREQLRHLLAQAQLANVTIQVLPYSAQGHAGLNGSFSIFTAHNLDIVLVENLTQGWYLEQVEETKRYSLVFDHLRAVSLSESNTLDLIERLVSEA